MSFAYWSILIVGILPYLCVLYAKADKRFTNAAPRDYLENLGAGRQKRAYWAHQNTFEILPLYFAAIILGHLQNIDQTTLNGLAAAFIIFRIAYIFAYILDRPTLRSIIWAGGFGCIFGIFLLCV